MALALPDESMLDIGDRVVWVQGTLEDAPSLLASVNFPTIVNRINHEYREWPKRRIVNRESCMWSREECDLDSR